MYYLTMHGKMSTNLAAVMCILLFANIFLSNFGVDAKKKSSEIIIFGGGDGSPNIYKSQNGKYKELYIIGRRKRSVPTLFVRGNSPLIETEVFTPNTNN